MSSEIGAGVWGSETSVQTFAICVRTEEIAWVLKVSRVSTINNTQGTGCDEHAELWLCEFLSSVLLCTICHTLQREKHPFSWAEFCSSLLFDSLLRSHSAKMELLVKGAFRLDTLMKDHLSRSFRSWPNSAAVVLNWCVYFISSYSVATLSPWKSPAWLSMC